MPSPSAALRAWLFPVKRPFAITRVFQIAGEGFGKWWLCAVTDQLAVHLPSRCSAHGLRTLSHPHTRTVACRGLRSSEGGALLTRKFLHAENSAGSSAHTRDVCEDRFSGVEDGEGAAG